MSWTSTHERMSALAEAVAEIERNNDGALPWNSRLAGVFGDRTTLLDALRYRMRLIAEAQDSVPAAELAQRHAAVLRVLQAAGRRPHRHAARLELVNRSIA